MTFSRRFAALMGIVLALGETLRRWHQLNQLRMWPAWLDDVVLGGLLIYGAWRRCRGLMDCARREAPGRD